MNRAAAAAPRHPAARGTARAIACALLSITAMAGAAIGADATFDREQAIGISQAALGRPVGDVTLIRTDGRPQRLGDFRGKPLVVSLVFTSCAHICPATTRHLARAVETAREALGPDSFRVITVGFDSRRDTPQMMADFARRQRVDLTGWEFLAADAATIEQLSADLGFLYYPAGGGFDHLIQSTVIDAGGVVYRQIYGIDFPIPHLVEPLKALVFGSRPEQSLLEELGNRIRLFCTVYDPASDSYRFRYDIFVGLIVGLSLGLVAAYLVLREWQRTRAGVGRSAS